MHVVALSAAAAVPSKGEGGPKDTCDKQVGIALKNSFVSRTSFGVSVRSPLE